LVLEKRQCVIVVGQFACMSLPPPSINPDRPRFLPRLTCWSVLLPHTLTYPASLFLPPSSARGGLLPGHHLHGRQPPSHHAALSSRQDKSGNCVPGTVVDSGITHSSHLDVFLNSHAGPQGHNKAAHYHVLVDENSVSVDGLQLLTYWLCYLYWHCSRWVGLERGRVPAHGVIRLG